MRKASGMSDISDNISYDTLELSERQGKITEMAVFFVINEQDAMIEIGWGKDTESSSNMPRN